jgi:L-threonine-O-3-phosphate decarboxylase
LAGCPPAAILDFSASINPLGPPKSAITAIQAALQDLSYYPDPSYQSLRLALAGFHSLDPEWLLPGNGSAELLTWAGRDLSSYRSTLLVTFQGQVFECPLRLESSPTVGEPADVQQQCQSLSLIAGLRQHVLTTDPATQGLLFNNPHNPTGLISSIEELLPYLQQFALVVVDEAFMDFLPPQRQQSLIPWVQQFPNLIILRSLTKFYSLPGLRLGYAIAHPDRLRQWQQWRDPWPVNNLAEAAGIAAVQDQAFQRQTWAWLETARSQLYEGLTALPGLCPLPGSANYLLVRSQPSVTHLQEQLLRQNQILIRDCLSFPELGDRYFRVAVRTSSENQRLLDSLTAILGT